MSRGLRIRPNTQPLILSGMRETVTDLGPVDDPFLTVKLCSSLQTRKICSSFRLRVAKRNACLTMEDSGEEIPLIVFRPAPQDDGCDGCDSYIGLHPGVFELIHEHVVVKRRPS